LQYLLPPTWRDAFFYREKPILPYRQQWLKENRDKFKYDEKRSCFVVP